MKISYQKDNTAFVYGLPVIKYNDLNIFYSYYVNKIAVLNDYDLKRISNENLKKQLDLANFLGEPKFTPGEYSDMVELVLSLTNDCNLRCKYCFVAEDKFVRKTISKDIIIDALNSIKKLAKNKEKSKIMITFFGGEPTLKPDLIEFTIEKAKELLFEFDIIYGITTNGVFNDYVLNLLIENDFLVTISMDGLPKYQDVQRITDGGHGTSKLVERTIRTLAKSQIPIVARLTVTRPMLDDFKSIIDYCEEIGVNVVHFEAVTKGGRARDNSIQRPFAEEFSDKIIEAIEYVDNKNIKVLTSGIMNVLCPSLTFCDGAGKNKLAVTYEGTFSSCLGIQTKNHPLANSFISDKNNLDSWSNQKIEPLVSDEHFSKSNCKNFKCKDCFARYVCSGGCPSRNFYACGDPYSIDDMQCILSKKLLKKYILDIYLNEEKGATNDKGD